MNNFTFCITYWAHPEFLEICLDSVNKFHPHSPIIISQQIENDFNYKQPGSSDKVRIEYHDMKNTQWASVATNLMMVCQTDYAVFMEHDVFLLKSLGPLMNQVVDGKYDLIGPEEICNIRNSPGMVAQNFFIINVKKMKEEGLGKIWVRNAEEVSKTCKNMESGYGISQTLTNKKLMKMVESGYGHGTYYDNYAHHQWYGSYRKRETLLTDLVPRDWLEEEAQRTITDYKNGTFK